MRKTKLGILGGTFDPIHIGHLVVADSALDSLDLDAILFVPAGSPPHKQGEKIASVEHRIAMAELATAGRPQFLVSSVDARNDHPAYTYELLERLHDAYEDATFTFIMGADSLLDFATWKRPERILELAEIAVAGRPGYEIDESALDAVPQLRARLRLVDAPLCDISSTEIRERIEEERPVRYVVPEQVLQYIGEHRVYPGADVNDNRDQSR